MPEKANFSQTPARYFPSRGVWIADARPERDNNLYEGHVKYRTAGSFTALCQPSNCDFKVSSFHSLARVEGKQLATSPMENGTLASTGGIPTLPSTK